MFTSLKRVFNFAFANFYRNKGVSVAAVFVLMVTTLLVTGIFFAHGVGIFLIQTVQNKIDITAYFKEGVVEQDILNVRNEILKNSANVKTVEYVSKDDALAIFTQTHGDSKVFDKALAEVGGNPFLPALNIITTGSLEDYQKVADILKNDQYAKFIEKVDFSEKKATIEKVLSVVSNINKAGLATGLALVLLSILVIFNTIKLVIFSSKEEIATMRIIGASNWFIRAPFVIEGAIFGVISFIACFAITGSASYFLSSQVATIMPDFNLFGFFLSRAWILVGLQLGFGAGLATVASLIVVRKYLKV